MQLKIDIQDPNPDQEIYTGQRIREVINGWARFNFRIAPVDMSRLTQLCLDNDLDSLSDVTSDHYVLMIDYNGSLDGAGRVIEEASISPDLFMRVAGRVATELTHRVGSEKVHHMVSWPQYHLVITRPQLHKLDTYVEVRV